MIGRVPKLKFLDAGAVTNEEREGAAKLMQSIARMPTEEYKKVAEGYVVSEDKGLDKIETNVVEGKLFVNGSLLFQKVQLLEKPNISTLVATQRETVSLGIRTCKVDKED